jgi:hypothetical protein
MPGNESREHEGPRHPHGVVPVGGEVRSGDIVRGRITEKGLQAVACIRKASRADGRTEPKSPVESAMSDRIGYRVGGIDRERQIVAADGTPSPIIAPSRLRRSLIVAANVDDEAIGERGHGVQHTATASPVTGSAIQPLATGLIRSSTRSGLRGGD